MWSGVVGHFCVVYFVCLSSAIKADPRLDATTWNSSRHVMLALCHVTYNCRRYMCTMCMVVLILYSANVTQGCPGGECVRVMTVWTAVLECSN